MNDRLTPEDDRLIHGDGLHFCGGEKGETMSQLTLPAELRKAADHDEREEGFSYILLRAAATEIDAQRLEIKALRERTAAYDMLVEENKQHLVAIRDLRRLNIAFKTVGQWFDLECENVTLREELERARLPKYCTDKSHETLVQQLASAEAALREIINASWAEFSDSHGVASFQKDRARQVLDSEYFRQKEKR